LRSIQQDFGPGLEWLGLECRLGDDDQVDLMVCASGNIGRRGMAAASRRWPDSWVDAREMVGNWTSPGTASSTAPYLWLELDLERGQDRPPIPFLPLEPEVAEPPRPEHVLPLLAEGVGLAGLRHLPAVLRAARLIPPGGWPLHVAPLRARGLDQVRLVADLPHPSVQRWLEALGWKGSPTALERVLGALRGRQTHVSVAVDLGADGGLDERVGLDCFFPAPPATDPRWSPVLALLRHVGARQDRLEAFQAWHGDFEADGRAWSGLCHSKVLIRGDQLGAKVYLALRNVDGSA
jgi:hypothetical protein